MLNINPHPLQLWIMTACGNPSASRSLSYFDILSSYTLPLRFSLKFIRERRLKTIDEVKVSAQRSLLFEVG